MLCNNINFKPRFDLGEDWTGKIFKEISCRVLNSLSNSIWITSIEVWKQKLWNYKDGLIRLPITHWWWVGSIYGRCTCTLLCRNWCCRQWQYTHWWQARLALMGHQAETQKCVFFFTWFKYELILCPNQAILLSSYLRIGFWTMTSLLWHA